MPDVGVRELKARASEIIREVREQHARYVITYRGRPVGLLMPLERESLTNMRPAKESAASVWDELNL